MSLSYFVSRLADLHAKAKRNELTREEKIGYEADREDLAATILNAQKISLKPGESARGALRVNRVLPIELTSRGVTSKAVTLEISATGFAVMVSSISTEWLDGVDFRLKLPGAVEVSGKAKVASTNHSSAHVRAGFVIDEISDSDREQIGRIVFDDLLEKLGRGAPKKKVPPAAVPPGK